MNSKVIHYKVIGKFFEWIACNPMTLFSHPIIFPKQCSRNKSKVNCGRCQKTKVFRTKKEIGKPK